MSIIQKPKLPKPAPTAAPPANDTSWVPLALELIDGIIQDRVLVYGSLPPEGSDLDILARPAELHAIREALVAEGFIPIRRMLVRFRPGSRALVELTPTDSWGLPPAELEALFAEGLPLEGAQRVVRASPQHTLLIRARKAVQRRTSLEKLRTRTDILPDDNTEAWRQASERAVSWRAQYALRMLKAVYEGQRVPTLIRWRALVEQPGGHEGHTVRGRALIMRRFLPPLPAFLPRIRPTYVVTFSGLDGSGKTSQARRLRDALLASGQDAVVVWAGIGTNRSLRWIKTPVKSVLRALPRVGPLKELTDRVTPRSDGKPNPLAEPGARNRRHGVWFNLTTQVWMAVMALANVYSMRRVLLRSFGRGRVIIFDRYTLDSAVRLRHWYGDSPGATLVIRLAHLLARRPDRAYFLDVPPQVAFERKPEWELHDLVCRTALYNQQYARLGVRRLDGTRPVDDLFAEIAADVWGALH